MVTTKGGEKIMQMKLNLIAMDTYMSKGETPELMRKFIFISERNKVYEGYEKDDQVSSALEHLCTNKDTYDETRARVWEVKPNAFKGVLTYRVDVESFQ